MNLLYDTVEAVKNLPEEEIIVLKAFINGMKAQKELEKIKKSKKTESKSSE